METLKKYIKNPLFFKLSIVAWIITIAVNVVVIKYIIPCNDKVRTEDIEETTYKSFVDKLDNKEIEYVYYTESSPVIYVYTRSGEYFSTNNPEYEQFKRELLEKDVIVKDVSDLKTAESVESNRKSTFVFVDMILIGVLSYFLYKGILSKNENGGNGKPISLNMRRKVTANGNNTVSNINKETARDEHTKLFSDIAGLCEVKKDMKCLVDFLVNKDKYEKAGAKLPKGVLLYGPPGTGKTLLAKAVAGEANVPFLYMSGSEFIEMYVGVGAKRIRELFNKARKQAPCIVFIDEIDTIGSKRGERDNGEDRKTINALLTEMDGFKETENIIVIAATNRLEDLDPALTRPGRFTDKFCVPLPSSAKERLEILKLYSVNKKFSDDISLEEISKETIGFSPADLESLLNEAAIISVQQNKEYIDREVMEVATFKILLSGHIKENNNDRDKDELELVAWHEAGHALIGKLLGKEVTKVTIVSSTSGAGGVTFSTPKKESLHSVRDLKNEVLELYGGRCAELKFFNDPEKITTGASNDIDRATDIIKSIVTRYAMTDEYGLLNIEKLGLKQDIIISKEVELSRTLYNETNDLLEKYYDKLKLIAEKLLENETLYSNDLDLLLNDC